jgi:hypothetical protein
MWGIHPTRNHQPACRFSPLHRVILLGNVLSITVSVNLSSLISFSFFLNILMNQERSSRLVGFKFYKDSITKAVKRKRKQVSIQKSVNKQKKNFWTSIRVKVQVSLQPDIPKVSLFRL